MQFQVCLAADKDWIHCPELQSGVIAQLVRCGSLEKLNGLSRVVAVELDALGR